MSSWFALSSRHALFALPLSLPALLCPSRTWSCMCNPEGHSAAQQCSAATLLPPALSARDRKSKRPRGCRGNIHSLPPPLSVCLGLYSYVCGSFVCVCVYAVNTELSKTEWPEARRSDVIAYRLRKRDDTISNFLWLFTNFLCTLLFTLLDMITIFCQKNYICQTGTSKAHNKKKKSFVRRLQLKTYFLKMMLSPEEKNVTSTCIILAP